MTIAQEILDKNYDETPAVMAYDAYIEAEAICTKESFVYDGNFTVTEFSDGSKLKFSENKVELL